MDPEAAGRRDGPPAVVSIFAPSVRPATIAILTTVALSAFEGLAVAAALPLVAAELGDVALLPWVVTAYLMAAGVATIVAGAMVDSYGPRRVFRWSVVLFLLGAVLAAVAPSMAFLIAARVLHGVGGGGVNAVGLAAVGLVFPSRLVGRAFAANATVWGVMSVAGPGLAAVLLLIASWRWIFWVNVPLCAIVLLAGWSAMPGPVAGGQTGGSAAVGQPRGRAVDPVSVLLLVVVMAASLLAVDRLDLVSLVLLAVSIAAGVAVLRRQEARGGVLLSRTHLLSSPLGPLGGAVALLLAGSIGATTFLPLMITAGRGGSSSLAAWSVVFFTLGWTAGSNVASRLAEPRADGGAETRSEYRIARAGVMIGPVGLTIAAAVAWLTLPLPVLFAAHLVIGGSCGITTNAALTMVRVLSIDDELGRATAAHQFVRNLGFAAGNALTGSVVLLVVAQTSDVDAVVRLVSEEGGGGTAPGLAAAAVNDGYAAAMLVGAGVAACAIPLLARLRHAVTAPTT